MDRRKQTGRQGEDTAAVYLLEKGYRIIERNWVCRTGELDIMAQDGDILVFVEVRARRGKRFGPPEESPADRTGSNILARNSPAASGLAYRRDCGSVRAGITAVKPHKKCSGVVSGNTGQNYKGVSHSGHK
jgi:Holliday junction resolvase-like predicted endonuclease